MYADRNSSMHLKEMLCVGIQINFSSGFGNFVYAIPQQGSISLSAYEIPRDPTSLFRNLWSVQIKLR